MVAVHECDGRTLIAMFKTKAASVDFIKARVGKSSTIYADERIGWDKLGAKFPGKVINHSLAYSTDEACTYRANSFLFRLRRAELGQHHGISGIYLGRYGG